MGNALGKMAAIEFFPGLKACFIEVIGSGVGCADWPRKMNRAFSAGNLCLLWFTHPGRVPWAGMNGAVGVKGRPLFHKMFPNTAVETRAVRTGGGNPAADLGVRTRFPRNHRPSITLSSGRG